MDERAWRVKRKYLRKSQILAFISSSLELTFSVELESFSSMQRARNSLNNMKTKAKNPIEIKISFRCYDLLTIFFYSHFIRIISHDPSPPTSAIIDFLTLNTIFPLSSSSRILENPQFFISTPYKLKLCCIAL